MTRLLCLSLGMSILLSCGCSSLPSSAQLEDWKGKVDRGLASASTAIEKVKAGVEVASAKLDAMKEAQAAQLANIEAIAGPLDTDGDGKVTAAEAAATVKKLKETPEGTDLLFQWQTWATLAGAWVGLKGAQKGGAVALKTFHKVGRKLAGPSGDVT